MTLLAVALTDAVPPAMTTVAAERVAEAPLAAGLAANLITPPFTGSTGLLAFTVTASALANAAPTLALCGVLPATVVRLKPWLSKAPISTAPTRPLPRWSVAGAPVETPALMAGLPGNRAMVFVGPP